MHESRAKSFQPADAKVSSNQREKLGLEQEGRVEGFAEISREELKEEIQDREDNFTLLDVRDKEAFKKSHLPHAINLPVDDLRLMMPRLVPNLWEHLVVYCGSAKCDASLRAAQILAEMDYKRVNRYVGGLDDWTGAGLPIESDFRPEKVA